MLFRATTYRRNVIKGRWVVVTRHRRQPWKVIVEPDFDAKLLVVISAYPLPRRPGDRSYHTSRAEPGLVIDFNRKGQPIGIEITAPDKLSLAALNPVLRDLGFPAGKRVDLAPLRAA